MKDEFYKMPITMWSKNVMTSPEYIAEQEEKQLLPSILINSALWFSSGGMKNVFSLFVIFFYIYTHTEV